MELYGVVLPGLYRLGKVFTNLIDVHVEGGHHVDISDMVRTHDGVHDAGNIYAFFGFPVLVYTLDKRGCAVTHTHDGDVDLPQYSTPELFK